MSNTNQWNADKYKKHADFVSNLAFPVVELLNPQANEKILDLGCGDGTLAVEIEKFNAKVIAVDLSESMVQKTKEKGIEAFVMSATDLTFENYNYTPVSESPLLITLEINDLETFKYFAIVIILHF